MSDPTRAEFDTLARRVTELEDAIDLLRPLVEGRAPTRMTAVLRAIVETAAYAQEAADVGSGANPVPTLEAVDALDSIGTEPQAPADAEEVVAVPVVPEGYTVIQLDGRWRLFGQGCTESEPPELMEQDGACVMWSDGNDYAPVDAAAALALCWAIQHDEEPRHAGRTLIVSEGDD